MSQHGRGRRGISAEARLRMLKAKGLLEGLTPAQVKAVASELGLTEDTVQKWQQGILGPSPSTLQLLEKAVKRITGK